MTIKTTTEDQSHTVGNDVKEFREKIKKLNQNTESWVMKLMTNHMLKSEIKLKNDEITVISRKESKKKEIRPNPAKNALETQEETGNTEILSKNEQDRCETNKNT